VDGIQCGLSRLGRSASGHRPLADPERGRVQGGCWTSASTGWTRRSIAYASAASPALWPYRPRSRLNRRPQAQRQPQVERLAQYAVTAALRRQRRRRTAATVRRAHTATCSHQSAACHCRCRRQRTSRPRARRPARARCRPVGPSGSRGLRRPVTGGVVPRPLRRPPGQLRTASGSDASPGRALPARRAAFRVGSRRRPAERVAGRCRATFTRHSCRARRRSALGRATVRHVAPVAPCAPGQDGPAPPGVPVPPVTPPSPRPRSPRGGSHVSPARQRDPAALQAQPDSVGGPCCFHDSFRQDLLPGHPPRRYPGGRRV
jgi:hypothetical protein